MVMGGYNRGSLHDAEFVDFSPFKNVSVPKPADLPETMTGPVANLVEDCLIACGGDGVANCYIYNMEDNTWLKTVSLDQPRFLAVDFVMGDSWYILGGWDSTTDPYTYLDSTLVYTDGVFHPWHDLPYPASGACIINVNETHVFYAGGSYGSGYKSDAFLLEVYSWKWTSLHSMTTQRCSSPETTRR